MGFATASGNLSTDPGIRLYYQFYNVDTDRYHLADGYHQVMLSARELSPELPEKARTWVNEYLEFTHGYGLVMNFVSKKVGGGFPDYTLENVPAESNFGLTIAQPAIYYGQSMPGYRIVATDVKEFDYPKGNDNVYTSYRGKGGIPLDNIWKRLLFAWNKTDINILLTSYLRPESRIQIHRDVRDRVAQIAPFLRLDNDPYAVLSEGKLYWVQDAYTVSSYFPYGNPEWTGQNNMLLESQSGPGISANAQGPDAGGTDVQYFPSSNSDMLLRTYYAQDNLYSMNNPQVPNAVSKGILTNPYTYDGVPYDTRYRVAYQHHLQFQGRNRRHHDGPNFPKFQRHGGPCHGI